MITAALAVIGQLSDARTTQFALAHGDKELNPLMRKVLNKFGVTGLYLVKVGAAVGFALAGYWEINLILAAAGFALGGKNYALLNRQGFKLKQVLIGWAVR